MNVKIVIMTLFLGMLLACNKGGDNSSPSLVSIAVTPANQNITLGKTQQFSATGTYSDSGTKDLTASATWTTSSAAIAAIDNAGLTSTVSAGTATVTAISGGVSGSTTLTVTAAASQPLIYGLKLEADAMQSASQTELHFQMAQDLGLGFVKVVVPMNMVANPTTGVWDWTLTDQIAAFAQQYGISLIPMFLSPDDPVKQVDAAAFAQFAYTYVARYRDSAKIEYVEFQNEPNQFNDGTGWKGVIPVLPGSWQGTAKQLVDVDNAAYDQLKAAFPGLIVGSAGFISESNQAFDAYTTKFLNAYFAAQPKPKFDVFMYHFYPKNSSYAQGDSSSALTSGWHIFEGYRSLLEQTGYGAKPIFVAEGHVDTPALVNGTKVWNWISEDEDMASTLWVERFLRVLASSNASNVTGHVLSGAWGSGSETLVDSATGNKRKQYSVVKLLLESLRRFPIYSRKIAGAANDGGHWIEEFHDAQGKRMWVCLNPILYWTNNDLQMPAETSYTWTVPQNATLDVSPAAAVKVSTTSGTQLVTTAGGSVTLTIGAEPIIVEE